MQLLGIGRAEQVDHGIGAIGPDPHGVDHERVAFVMTDRIAVPGWRHLCGMLVIHAHPAHFMILVEQHDDPVRQLQHRHGHVLEQERHGLGPALIAGVRIGHASQRQVALIPHDIRRPGLQDRIRVVADQLGIVARAVIGPPRLVRHRPRPRRRRNEPGQRAVPPDAGEIRHR